MFAKFDAIVWLYLSSGQLMIDPICLHLLALALGSLSVIDGNVDALIVFITSNSINNIRNSIDNILLLFALQMNIIIIMWW